MFSVESSGQRVINIKANLNNGRKFPIISFGTFQIISRNTVYNALDAAFRSGYRSIDTAAVYRNEADIGYALKQLLPKYNLNREDIFITSKLAPGDHGNEKTVTAAVRNSLQNLDTPYLDLYLIHWPAGGGISPSDSANTTIRASTWKTLEKLYDNGNGILKSIGVSNFTAEHIAQIIVNGKVVPAVNQVEFHPHWQQTSALHDICKKHNILLQAYSSLGGSGNCSLVQDPVVNDVANRNNISTAQVLLRWALQKQYAVVPKSVTPERIAVNANLNQVLSEDDMKALNGIQRRQKYAWNPEAVC